MPDENPVHNEVLAVAVKLHDFCKAQGWRFCFTGGLAVQKWSEPRVTDDVALTLITGFGAEAPFVDALLALDRLVPRHPNAREFVPPRRVLLVQSEDGIGVDIALGAFPFEEQAAARAVEVELLPGSTLRICTAEDLIVFKVFAARPKDWSDVEATIIRQGDASLDWACIRDQLIPLLALKEMPGLRDELESRRRKIQRRTPPLR